MKKNITAVFAVFAIVIGLSNTVFSQDKKQTKKIVSDTLFVQGVCDMCKDRIENAALIKGVKKASYDKQSHELIVFYKPEKVNLDTIEKEIAKAGHDTRNYKADNEVYNRLPECCAYRSGDVHLH